MHPARYKALFEHGCVCCRALGWYGIPQMHHLVDHGYRRLSGGDAATLPLCAWHHEGYPPASHTNASATEAFGPSLAHGKKPFQTRWGTERELLAILDAALVAGTEIAALGRS